MAVSAEDALIAQHASLALKRRETSSASNKGAPVEVLERRARNRDKTSAQVSILRSVIPSLSISTFRWNSFSPVSLHFNQ